MKVRLMVCKEYGIHPMDAGRIPIWIFNLMAEVLQDEADQIDKRG